jgi:TolB-like protein
MKPRVIATFILLVATSALAASPPGQPAVPRLAVLPFFTPSDRDYGVLISDRLVTSLFHHRDVPSLNTRRFELVEPDALDDERMSEVLGSLPDLKPENLEVLRRACPAEFVILGKQIIPQRVMNPGVKNIDISIIHLESGEVIWTDRIKHDVRYIWLSKDWQGGESFVRKIITRLGFVEYDRQLPVFDREFVPTNISLMPFYNIDNPILVKAAERFVHQGLIEGKVFKVVDKGKQRLPRAESAARERAKGKKADAIFIGSMMDAGMEEAIEENVTAAARLVDVNTGRILWSGSSSDRRVWRRQTPDAMAEFVSNQLVADFFETIKRTEAQRMEKLRRRIGIRIIR